MKFSSVLMRLKKKIAIFKAKPTRTDIWTNTLTMNFHWCLSYKERLDERKYQQKIWKKKKFPTFYHHERNTHYWIIGHIYEITNIEFHKKLLSYSRKKLINFLKSSICVFQTNYWKHQVCFNKQKLHKDSLNKVDQQMNHWKIEFIQLH